ncbi:hypothetical protein [Marasmitruncus massiliensis]|nr:hypothetical protein [Marasmitruncus massiliensis]
MNIGSIICAIMASLYITIIAFTIWIVLFFREVHLDIEKAFNKYKL